MRVFILFIFLINSIQSNTNLDIQYGETNKIMLILT